MLAGKGRVLKAACGSVAAALAIILGGCATRAQQADSVAAHAGMSRTVLEGSRFHHVSYERIVPGAPAGDFPAGDSLAGRSVALVPAGDSLANRSVAGRSVARLFIFVDGDGRPWVRGGRATATDPTSRHPLLLDLAAQTQTGSVLYLGRPCYLGLARTIECQPSDWTSARYSTQIVESLAAAANRFVSEHDIQEVILIGHSGGGTLAVLMAPQVEHLRAVVTIAGNLDVSGWSAFHAYLPLAGSLDPAAGLQLPKGVTEIHLVGGVDRNVPPQLMQRYLAGHPGALVWTYPTFNHECCWREAWPEVLPRLMDAIVLDRGASGPVQEGSM